MTTTLKRDRLVEAAKTMFYQHGVTQTTLAEIAEQVPLGNVYYYFRTKDALVEAVIETYVQELQSIGQRRAAEGRRLEGPHDRDRHLQRACSRTRRHQPAQSGGGIARRT